MKKFFIFTLVIIVSSIFFWEKGIFRKKSLVVGMNDTSHAHSSSHANSSSSLTSNGQNKIVPNKETRLDVDNAVIAKKLEAWANERGYDINAGNISDYDSYDSELLKQLSKQGDVKAMMRLGDYYLKKNMKTEAVEVYNNSIVYGATLSAVALASLVLPIKSDFVNESEKAKAFYGSLAYYKFAKLRGDDLTSNSMFQSTIKIYNLNLSEQDYAEIDKMAKTLYSKYEGERERLGLGVFDNKSSAN